jgi:hypothetical protein
MLSCGIFVPRKVLEVKEGTDQVRIHCPHGGPNALWYFEEDGTIRNKIGKVLDVLGESRTPGAPLIAHPRHGRWNQIFRIVRVSV